MKKILLVAATLGETQLLRENYLFFESENIYCHKLNNLEITLIHTGIGMVNTAYVLGKYLANHQPDFAINFGIGGSFDNTIKLGDVVEIIEDSFAELGAEDNGNFLNLQKMGFPTIENPIHYNTFYQPDSSNIFIPKTTAITVNTVHGEAVSIQKCLSFWNKQVETMESAAFFQVMIAEQIKFYAFRSISNYVEPRNRANWQIGLAIRNINLFIIQQLESQQLFR